MNAKRRATEWMKRPDTNMIIQKPHHSDSTHAILVDLVKELEQAESERDRYREALQSIIDDWTFVGSSSSDYGSRGKVYYDTARAALGGE